MTGLIIPWTNNKPEFILHFSIKMNTVNNVWDFSKLKHEDKDTPADLMLEVLKLINNVSSTAKPNQDTHIKDNVKKLVIESNKSLKNHLMKTIFINKLAPAYKEYLLAKEPDTFQEANNLAEALWRRRFPEGVPFKPKSIFLSFCGLVCLRDIKGLVNQC